MIANTYSAVWSQAAVSGLGSEGSDMLCYNLSGLLFLFDLPQT
jgi:hypothetical protein